MAVAITGSPKTSPLDRVLDEGPSPRPITVDHGMEFQSRVLEGWAYRRGVQLDPANPWETPSWNPAWQGPYIPYIPFAACCSDFKFC
jgi:hypothetical protein